MTYDEDLFKFYRYNLDTLRREEKTLEALKHSVKEMLRDLDALGTETSKNLQANFQKLEVKRMRLEHASRRVQRLKDAVESVEEEIADMFTRHKPQK